MNAKTFKANNSQQKKTFRLKYSRTFGTEWIQYSRKWKNCFDQSV